MIAEIGAAIQSAKALSDLLKAGYELRNANEFAAAINELHAKLASALSVAAASEESKLALTRHVADLEKENVELKDWNRDAERYQLSEIATGVFAYRVKPGMEQDEPSHLLCANCFSQRQKAISAPVNEMRHSPLEDYF